MCDPELRPRLKTIHPAYRAGGSRFRVGAQLGVTVEFEDPEGQMWALVDLLDGVRCVDEIVDVMLGRFSTLTRADVIDGLRLLDREGFVEDARHPGTTGLSEAAALRYAGNIAYFSHFARLASPLAHAQATIRRAKVVLLGLGGAGSNILAVLSAAGFGSITAVDYDRVSVSNLNRQFLYRESDVGRLKTDAARAVIAAANSDLQFSTVTRRVEASEDLLDIVPGADLVICAIDEPPFLAQRRVNHACVMANVPCLYALQQVTRGRVFSVIPKSTGCFDCLNIHYSIHDPSFVPQFRGFFETSFDPPTIAFAPDIIRLSGAVVDEATRLLVGHTEPRSLASQLELDHLNGATTTLTTWPRYEQYCPTCGDGYEWDWPVFGIYPGSVSRGK